MASHLYSPLNVSTWEFRILRLLPGEAGTTIRCELQLHTISYPPKYMALSYCWGEKNDRRPTIVNDTEITITTNLEEALQQLRAIGVDLVWVDALCINQQDVQERSLQVRFMKQIYSKAQATYSWIGSSQLDDAAKGLRYLQQISSGTVTVYEKPTEQASAAQRASRLAKIGLNRSHNTTSQVAELHPINLVEFEASFNTLLDLLNRLYWQRRWIIQEAAAARTTKVMCGDVMLDLEEICQALQSCSENNARWTNRHELSHRFVAQLAKWRKLYHETGQPGLFEAIFSTKDSRSKDERDKIFALLGICRDGDALVPTPNYEERLEDLNINLKMELLRRNGALEVMFVDQREKSHLSTLPSWCPDWLAPDLSREAYKIAQWPRQPASPNILYSFQDDGRIIQVQGVEFGVVVAVTSILDDSEATIGAIPDVQPPAQPGQNVRYYGWRQVAALTLCLRSSTRSQRVPGVRYMPWLSTSSAFNLFLLLAMHEGKIGTRRAATGNPLWPPLKPWLVQNKDFVVGGRPLYKWTEQSALSRWPLFCLFWLACHPEIAFSILVIPLPGSFVSMGFLLFSVGAGTPKLGLFISLTFGCLAGSLILYSIVADMGTFLKHIQKASAAHSLPSARLVVLNTGALALACSSVQVGDKICLIAGCDSSPVLRSVDSVSGEEPHLVVGRSFVCMSTKDAEQHSPFCDPRLREGTFDYFRDDPTLHSSTKESDQDEKKRIRDSWTRWSNHHKKSGQWRRFLLI